MRKSTVILVASIFLLPACGGLQHIHRVDTEPAWRPLQRAGRATEPVRTARSRPGVFVAVFDIEDRSHRLKAEELEGLTDYLAGKVAEGGRFRLIPRDQIKKRLLEQKKESYRSCYDQACQIEIGREVAAEKALSTVIAAVGSSCLVTVALFDLKKAATDATATSRGGCSPEQLVDQIDRVVGKLRGR